MSRNHSRRFGALGVLLIAAILLFTVCSRNTPVTPVTLGQAHDFTVVYRFKRINREKDLTDQQIQEGMAKHDAMMRFMGYTMSDAEKQSTISRLQSSIERAKVERKDEILVLSTRGKAILVKRFRPSLHQAVTFLYDGQRTFTRYKGSNAEVFDGLRYEELSDFVFPGCSVAALPLAQNLKLTTKVGENDLFSGRIVMNDGSAEANYLPQYHPGTLQPATVDGMTQVVHSTSGLRNQYFQDVRYTQYKKVDGGLAFPAHIHLALQNRAGGFMPMDIYQTVDYDLVRASSQSLPEQEFAIEGQTKTGMIVLKFNKKGVSNGLIYKKGASLDEQFAQQANLRRGTEFGSSDANSWVVPGIIGGIILLMIGAGAYVYRRVGQRHS